MEPDDTNALNSDQFYDGESHSAVNSCILDYYKKFGRKRDLEQYFSLSTAQGDVCDPSGLFWRRMKAQYDSDSGEKKSESSTELCRVSIKCSIPAQSFGCQKEKSSTPTPNADLHSPPIITEEKALKLHQAGNDNSDDNSQKSVDVMDTSVNKLPSPTSSINSQRKLEWDSLADVGYINEGDRKTSSSSLSTLERLALQQQYSNNENVKGEFNVGMPTAQSTPVEETQDKKLKGNRKSLIKTTKYYKKDVDYVQVNVPQECDSTRPINVNLTKHISFNVGDKNNVIAQTSSHEEKLNTPKMVSVETVVAPELLDKEIQTSLTRHKDSQSDVLKISELSKSSKNNNKKPKSLKTPVTMHLNNLRRYSRYRKNKSRNKRPIYKKTLNVTEKLDGQQQEKTDPVSEAESFEYMPGHVYQNQNKNNQNRTKNSLDNKSSLESSSHFTTESSKESNISFTRDLERSIDQLKKLVEKRQKNVILKNTIVKEIVQKLIKSKYKDDDSCTDLISGFSFNSKLFDWGQGDNTTTSTSDQNNTAGKLKEKPKKSILRKDKLGRNALSTMQSYSSPVNAMNKHNISNLKLSQKAYSNSESEGSSSRYSSEGVKTSSEELYLKYLSAYKKEKEYKKYLKEKELFLKQKLTSSTKHNKPRLKKNTYSRELNELLKDLTTTDYNNGSGDAFKLPSNNNITEKCDLNKELKPQKCHSVYTLSSGNSANVSCSHCTHKMDTKPLFSNSVPEKCDKEKCTKSKKNKEDKNSEGCRNYCCIEHFLKARNMTDCSIQVDLPIKPQQKTCSVNTDQQCDSQANLLPAHFISEKLTGELKYVCLCTKTEGAHSDMPDNLLIYKCSCLATEKRPDDHTEPFRTDELQFKAYECAIDNLITKKKDCRTSNRNTSTVINKETQENDITPNVVDYKNTRDKRNNHQISELQNEIPNEQKNDFQIPTKIDNFGGSSSSVIKPSHCIQTDISIYPKTSDPTLSDILIIKETNKGRDCGVGVGQSIEKAEPKTDNMSYSGADSKIVEICSSKSKLSVSTTLSNEGYWDPQSDFRQMRNTEANTEKHSDNVKSSETKQSIVEMAISMTEERNKVCQGVNTEMINCHDKETSLHADCSKGVQCCNKISNKNLKNNDDSIEKHTSNEQHQIDDGVLHDKIFGKSNEVEFKCDNNNNDNCDILDDHSNAFRNVEEEYSIARRLCSEIPEHVQKLNKYHTYPPSKDVQKEKNSTPTHTCSNNLIVTDEKHDTEKVSKKLACLKLLNEVVSKENDLGKYSTVQTIKTEEIYAKNHSRNNKFSKSKSEGANEALSEFMFGRHQSKLANSDSLKESKSSGNASKSSNASSDSTKDPIMALIQNITKRYSKRELDKPNKKKCFKEIMLILNYLLDTEESTDTDNFKRSTSVTTSDPVSRVSDEVKVTSPHKKTTVDRATQIRKQTKSAKHPKKNFEYEESSDVSLSSDEHKPTNESPVCEVLNKIKKECERYQRRCKSTRNRKIEAFSSTSNHCKQSYKNQNDRHKCSHNCQNHKNSKHNQSDSKRKCIAYNLIIQTSDSMIHEETVYNKNHKPLQNIIVKVPRRPSHSNQANKIKSQNASTDKRPVKEDVEEAKSHRLHNSKFFTDIQINGENLCNDHPAKSVGEYLESNRPDFLEKSLKRQDCLKMIKETRARDREVERLLLEELEIEAPEIAAQLRVFDGRLPISRQRHIDVPKFTNEREMKKHSERIYKTLPEVTRKKEELRKQSIKRTNLIMAHLFNKNLQKRTLKGVVNISNYSTIVKI